MWKFQNSSATQILREIKSYRISVFAILGASINFSIQKVQKFIIIKIQDLKRVKMADFETLDSPTLISRKILLTEKFCNIPTPLAASKSKISRITPNFTTLQSVEISEFFCHSDFMWDQN